MMKYLIGLLAVIFMLGTFNIKIIPAQAGAVELSTPRAAVQLTPEELLDTSVKFEEDVLMIDIAGSIIDKKWMGSGVIIGDGTRVLTVYHVCKSKKPGQILGGRFKVIGSKKTILTSKNKRINVKKIIYKDSKNDICVVELDERAGDPADASAFLPESGDEIYLIGAPKGLWSAGPHIIDGRFVGIRRDPINGIHHGFAEYTLHAAPGASGSPIFYKGRVIGLLSHGHRQYSNVAYGPSLAQVRKAIAESKKQE